MFQAVIFIECFTRDLALEKKESCTRQTEIRRQRTAVGSLDAVVLRALSSFQVFPSLLCLSISLFPQIVTTFPVPDKPLLCCLELFKKTLLHVDIYSSGFAVLEEQHLVSNSIENQRLT